jgi:hypothetical protein
MHMDCIMVRVVSRAAVPKFGDRFGWQAMLPLDGSVTKPVPSYRIGTPKTARLQESRVSWVARPRINEAPRVVATPPATRPFGRRSPTVRHRTRRRTWRKVNTTEECSRWAPSWCIAPSWFFAGRR